MDSNNGIPTLDELQRQLNNDLAQNSAATPALTSTTISTIVVQGGPLQLVIAILKSGDLLYIKVADLLPKLTFLGVNLDEALNLQKQHEELLQQIQNLPTPLEEFYHKVQDKIASNERPNPSLIEDMANSLNTVWMDIKRMLHERRDITILNVSFFERLGECYGKISALEVACRDTMIPIEIESVREFLEKFKLLRTEMLNSIISTLKVGNQLLDKLRDLSEIGTLDSRPNHIKADAIKAVHQVEAWLEDLSNRRNSLELAWQSRKNQLEQCLTLAILAKELHEIEYSLNKSRDETLSSFNLGESESSADVMLQVYKGLKQDAHLLRDKSLKITKATEDLVSTGCFAGDEACAKAYSVLSNCTEYLDEIDHRETLLTQSKEFFRKAESLLLKLGQIELEMNNLNMRPSSPNVVSMHIKILHEVSSSIDDVLQLGYSLIDEVGRTKPEVMGVKHVVEQIESKKLSFEQICAKNSEQHLRVSEELNEFLERYNNLFTWLEMQKHNKIACGTEIHYMGENTSQAKDCLLMHHQLLNDLEIKGNAINNLLTKLTPYFEYLEDHQRDDIYQKIDVLRQNWIEIKNFIIERVDLLKLYIKFHQESETLTNLFSSFDIQIKTFKTNDDNTLQLVGSAWTNIQQQFAHLKNIGAQFNENINKVADPYLQKDRATQCVESILTEFNNRQLVISNEWENWNIHRQIDTILNEIMTANMETLSSTSKIEDQLYPIFTTDMDNPSDLVEFVNSKLQKVLYDIKSSENELSSRIEKIEKLETNDQETSDKIVQVKNNLNSIKTKLHTISADYSELIQVIDTFLQSIISCRENIKDYFSKKQPVDVNSVENIIENYELFKQNTMAHFRNLLQQSEVIIEKIKSQEPPCAKEHDTDRIITLLENLRSYFESETESENSELKKQHNIIEFEKGLNDVLENIRSLLEQLHSRKSDYGDSVDTANTTVASFEYYERNVELLEKRIEHFINTSKNITTQYADTDSYIQSELEKLRNKWDELLKNIQDHKSSMSFAIQYFQLIEIIETNYRNLNADLINANNKLTILNNSDLANDLINQIDNIIKQYETQQLQNLKHLSELSTSIYGYDKTVTLSTDNMKLFQTFYKIKNDVSDKAKMLSQIEEDESKDVVDREVQFQTQQSIEIETVDELKYAQEPQQPLLIQTVEEFKHENVHEIITELEYEPPFFTKPLEDTIIQEGQTIQFQCAVNGFPDPQIEWFKDGISIQNNPDYKTTKDVQGNCTLRIDETFPEDSAHFLCQASNSAGVAETTAKLSVRENEPQVIVAPPIFVNKLESGAAKEGSCFEFSCLVTGNPMPIVQWFKNDVCIDNSPDYNITFNNGAATLRLEEVFLEDQAHFTIKAENVAGIEQSSAVLSVEPLEPTEMPTFKTQLSNIMARVGQKIKLECEVGGIPVPDIFWTHNGKSFANRDVKFNYENDKATLVISEAFLKDAGLYTIIAKNLAGEKSSSCNVVVKGRLPNETSDSEIASDMEPIKPSVQLQLKDIAVFEGKTVRLDCVIVGQPEPEVIWYHNQRPVKESADFQLLFQGDRCSLLIQEVFLEDAGEYKVVAINSAGEASSRCNLSVTPLNVAEPAVRPPHDRLIPTEIPPKFEKLLSDILVPEGEKIEFECCLSGDPKPSIKWYLNNKEIEQNGRIKSEYRDDGIVKLIIENVCPEDRGVYTVKASNASGDAKCFSHLIVKSINGAEFQTAQVGLEEKFVCPSFRELFADRAVQENDSTKFECIVMGKPLPKIKWFFNDEPVHGKDFLASTSGDRQVLTIPNVSRGTAGKVSCIAENEIGKATCVAYVRVTPDGRLPTTAETMIQEDNSGSSFITMKKQVVTTSSSHSSSSTNNGVPQTQVHMTSSHLDHSFKKIGDQAPEVAESKQFNEFKQTNDLPPSIQQQTMINITKNNAAELHETIIANSGQISTGKPARRNVAPRFVSPLIGKIVDQGVDVVLEGIVDGYPAPEVKVTKNDTELVDVENHIKVSFSFNKITIELKNVGIKDAGRYTATITNAAGSAVSTADLVVKKSIFPPVFGRRLQAQAVKTGDRVIMDVEITGTPEPTVTWAKDNKPVNEALLSSFKLSQLGNCYKLILEAATLQDAGRFTVRATNAGGEAQSIADFAVFEEQPDQIFEVMKKVVFEDMIKKPEPNTQYQEQKTVSKSGFSAHHESSSESNIQGQSSESTVTTETRRTTEASMRMEHKVSFPDLPVTFSQRTQTQQIPQVSEGTMVESDVQHNATNTESIPTKTDSTQTPIQAVPESENENVETVSISKKSVIEYFENKSESAQAPTQPPPKPIKLVADEGDSICAAASINNAFQYFEKKIQVVPEEKYTRYEDLPKVAEAHQPEEQEAPKLFQKEELEIIPPKSVSNKISAFEKGTDESITSQTTQCYTSFSQTSQSIHQHQETVNGNGLPQPAELERLEKQEYVQQFEAPQLPTETILLPQHEISELHESTEPVVQEESVTSTFSSEKQEFFEKKEETINVAQPEEPQSVPVQEVQEVPVVQEVQEQVLAPIPEILMQEEHPQPAPEIVQPSEPIFRPQAEISHPVRSPSPRPSADGVAMEKLWTPSKSVEQTSDFYSSTQSQSSSSSFMKQEVVQSQQAVPFPFDEPLPSIYNEGLEKAQTMKETKQMFEEKILQETPPWADLKAPSLVQQVLPKPFKFELPQPEIVLEPGAPPEMCYAPKLSFERKKSQLEKIEQCLVLNLEREPARVPAGGVRLFPSSATKKMSTGALPPQRTVSGYLADTEESQTLVSSEEFKSFSSTESKTISSSSTSHHTQETTESSTGGYDKEYNSNTSISTSEVNHHVPMEPMPYMPELLQTVQQAAEKVQAAAAAAAPSPAAFVPASFVPSPAPAPAPAPTPMKVSDYESDFESKLISTPTWRPAEKDTPTKGFKSVRPVFTPIERRSVTDNNAAAPPPPSVFDNPPQILGSPRPKFEPIDKIKTQQTTFAESPKIEKPKPVNARHNHVSQQYHQQINQSNIKSSSKQTMFSQTAQTAPATPRYYTGVAGAPVHNALATETSNTMHMKETTDTCNRVVNMTQTRKVISLDNELEPFPYKVSPKAPPISYRQGQRGPPAATPTKFTPVSFRESDYESEHESGKIRPLWTPNPSDSDEPHYRSVRPQFQPRSTSVPRSYERVLTPMEFDTQPVLMPTKIDMNSAPTTPSSFVSTLYRDQTPTTITKQTTSKTTSSTTSKTQTLDRYASKKSQHIQKTQDDIAIKSKYTPINYLAKATNQMDSMNSAFKTKAHQFMNEVITDVKKPQKPILKKSVSANIEETRNGSNAQAYREESRVSQYGTKHVDPDTGIIYFKYDFGYEFGIIFPGEGRKIVGGSKSKSKYKNPRYINSRAGDIEVPVLHERTKHNTTSFGDDHAKKRHSLPNAQINGDYFNNNYHQTGRITPKFNYKTSCYETPEYSSSNTFVQSSTNTSNVIVNHQEIAAKNPPSFIAPLKDIAVVSGQPARFECIVLCDASANIAWTKNNVPIENNSKYNIEYRNGVCRLSIPVAYPDDAGQYCCLVNNHLGKTSTSAELVVPAHIWGARM